MRDWRILSKLEPWERTVCTGRHPNHVPDPDECRRVLRGVGFAGEFASRASWSLLASRFLRREMSCPGTVASQSVSAWAPLWASLAYADRMLHVVHHVADSELLRRLGPLGPHCHRYESRILARGASSRRPTAPRRLGSAWPIPRPASR